MDQFPIWAVYFTSLIAVLIMAEIGYIADQNIADQVEPDMIIMDQFPIWAVYITSLIAVLIMAEIGFRIGIWLQDCNSGEEGARMTGTVVAGMLGLMAFLMAFSIGIVIIQRGDRKLMVVMEAIAIGTA